MKLSGHLTLEIINELTGEVVNKIEQDNIITDLAYSDTNLTNFCYWSARNIFISTETATPVRSKTTIQCSGIAYQGSGQPLTQAFHNASPPYFVITQRLDSVVTARTFQTVGLTTSSGGQVININVPPHAYLLLNTPCTQEANQIVNLTYRVTVQDTVLSGTSTIKYPRWINDICYSMVYNQGIQDYSTYLYNMVANAPLPQYNWRFLYIANLLTRMTMEQTGGNGNRADATSVGSGQNTNFYRYKQYWDFYRSNLAGKNKANGRIINGMLSGYNISLKTGAVEPDPGFTRSAHSSMQLETTSNLQSAFAYSSTPPIDRGPMFLPDNNPAGTGLISFSEDPWTGVWPTIYRIKITTSGNVGTAKYVLGVKQFTGFESDSNFTYAATGKSFHPYICAVIEPYVGCHGWQQTMPILAYNDVLTVQADNTGISIINQFTGQHYDLDATTTPALPITNFRQMAFDEPNDLIYVACASTGLWKIDISNLASIVVTNEIATPAYAVDVSAAGVVYTFLNMATTVLTLTSSASSYVTDLGFAGTALTTSNRLYIYVNKLHADTRVAVVIRNGSPTSGLRSAIIYWWSLAAGDTSAYTTNIPYCGESQCSFAWCNNSDNRLWSGGGDLFSFGSATMINSAIGKTTGSIVSSMPAYDTNAFKLLDGTQLISSNIINMNVAQDIWGNFISFNNLGILYNPSTGTTFTSYNNTGNNTNQPKRVVMPNGILLCDIATYFLSTNGMSNALSSWMWYKWDGTNWIKAVNYNPDTNTFTDTTSTDTKTTTTGYLPLLDGINVRFENGATGTSFLVNEVYDQYVCKGILKTNDIYVYVENSSFYTQPVYEKVTITPTVITSGNSYGVVVDGAPGNISLSSATSAVTVNPLWHSILPEYTNSVMRITIDGTPVTNCFSETIDTIPSQASLNAGEIIVYRNGLIICSTSDATKTLAGYFSYVAKSD
jgi:hypothetical protein